MKLRDSGDYRCKVKNEYGVLEQRVALTVTPSDESMGSGAIRREMGAIFRKQLKLYSVLSRSVATIFLSSSEKIKCAGSPQNIKIQFKMFSERRKRNGIDFLWIRHFTINH